ncbi:UDP-N-acetylmuramoyl-L-alanyl-D-glutamate--2,6-diaminopimelate ligase [Evansella caseinilytica]|uniref:UDP-N-acetylmuramoyl-L-alanyl-D-glutamate--2,6-diaminopimelate ligase n=1 Tax=Evansella caseinilytica TaxID=1503961 RepID=A0A1H3MIH9_9BACI|nr:UDP-N-acetylmuramoyl-L-alanyl-D-glutamate--2,6-diaminopimelate ligase [Evansella caseinilytica]SDY76154.1 UDP-N-acetylmuramoyl-L-alanyl-D-glutamate--2,6-diaminopimelate ligase [Evansella caseinilytica]
MHLSKLTNHLPSFTIQNDADPFIHSLHMDHREVAAGSLFFCIKGYTVDGHDFAEKAVANGAVALVAEKELDVSVPVVIVRSSKRAMAVMSSFFYDFPTAKLKLIGVTGTNGKTTTTHLIDKILRDSGRKTGIIGTMYTKYLDKEIPVKNTTPESLVLQQHFSKMVTEGVETVAMEVSSHALVQGRVHGTQFDIAVFTNLSQDHLDFHGTMENYAQAKGLLFAQLGNGYHPANQPFAVLNVDDNVHLQLETMTAAPILTYGIHREADMMASDVQIDERGAAFTMTLGEEHVRVTMPMTGMFSVYNALAASSAAYLSGVSLQAIAASLSATSGVSGRFERVEVNQPFHVIVDYAHTPDSLENVLRTIREFAKGRISVVVGCGGDRDKTKRPVMASIAGKLADYVYLTSDNPRSEDPLAILQDMEQGMSGSDYKVIVDRKEAIYEAIRHAETDEVVLIAGKGHETYQTIGGVNHHFDDRLVAKEAVKECRT